MDTYAMSSKDSVIEYRVIRSRRKTIEIQIRPDGQVVVRAPIQASEEQIRAFVRKKSHWIREHAAAAAAREPEDVDLLSQAEIRELAERAVKVIPQRVAYYAPRVGVTYGRITIRNQRTRWGSCSAKGNLNFNCLLMLMPPEVLDSVVVHELCHRREMNHSPRFYALVRSVYPEYDRWTSWLKANGPAIMRRMTG